MTTNGNISQPDDQGRAGTSETPQEAAQRIVRESVLEPLLARQEELISQRFATLAQTLRPETSDALADKIWVVLKPKVEAQMQGVVNDLTARIEAQKGGTEAQVPSSTMQAQSGAVTVGGKVSEVISLADQVMGVLETRLVPLITSVLQVKNGAMNDEALIKSLQSNPWRAAYLGARLLPDNIAQARELAVLNAATLATTSALAKGIQLGAQARQGRLPGQEEMKWQGTPSNQPLGSSAAPSPSGLGYGLTPGSVPAVPPSALGGGIAVMHENDNLSHLSLADLLNQI